MSEAQVTNHYQIPDQLWEKLKPLLPPVLPQPKGGRPRMDDRQALEAIFFILSTGCQWNVLPRSLGASSTVHDRFQAWRDQGIFEEFWQAGLAEYATQVGVNWEWNAIDGAMVKAPLGGKQPALIRLTEVNLAPNAVCSSMATASP
jgi:transposase